MTKELQNLPPEERIKKLKEEEKKKQKEIEAARKKIKESEEELTERRKWQDKVPMPEFTAESLEGLSRGAQDIIKAQKGITKKEDLDEEDSSEEVVDQSEEVDLEETIARDNVDKGINVGANYEVPGTNFFGGPDHQPANLVYSPLNELQNQVKSVYASVKEKGYMSLEEQKQMININSAIDDKFRAYDAGKYSLSEEAALSAMVTKKITGRLLDENYQSKASDNPQNDWYK
tara:strand:- start:1003 stop:1698 length:696 start_codon:yes stop_codon:yes gene_type:complete